MQEAQLDLSIVREVQVYESQYGNRLAGATSLIRKGYLLFIVWKYYI